jgi:Tol biopolymer transport system component
MQPNLLLNLNSGEKIELNGDAPMVSPSRDKFANQIVDDNTLQYSIFIADPNDQKITQVLSKPDWFTASRWFDDQHLLIRTTNETPPYTVELFNPFTGETRALIPDFPGISQKEVDWEFSGPVSYDHSLVYAVYAFWDSDKAEHEYVLYNISSKTRLATLAGSSHETAYIFSGRIASRDGVSNNPPQWSPDDTSAAVISSAPEKPGAIDEIFAVTKDGEIQRLTYFANSYNTARINNLSWSPDGNSIAFWVSLDPAPYELPQNAYQNVNLAVLDTKTLEITIYCLNGDNIGETNGAPSTPKFLSYGVPAPIWSPDGTQLVIENRYADDNSRLLILDIPAGKSFELLKNVVPQGWMNPAPK